MSLDDLLAQLREEYLNDLPNKVARIESLYIKKEYKELETDFHKLKGTGKSYGLPEISQLGEIAERLMQIDLIEIDKVVPLVCGTLRKIKSIRSSGQIAKIESINEFQLLIQILGRADKSRRAG